MVDSIKTTTAGTGAVVLSWVEWLPVAVRVLVGVATFFYICLKIYKLLEK